MSYATQYALAFDNAFRERVTAASVDVAHAHLTDTRKDSKALANAVVLLADNAAGMIKLAARAFPAETDSAKVTDTALKAAVESSWLILAAAAFPDDAPKVGALPTG